MSQRSEIVTFSLISAEPRAWLVINCDHEKAKVIEMWKGYANRWSASAWLTPGDYDCRYYCGDDKHVVYQGPAQRSGSIHDGINGLVSVADLQPKTNGNQMTILIVEDNLVTMRALEKMLQNQGYAVHKADGYQSALNIAQKEHVDLAICDINLWDGDGCELLRELQKIKAMQAIAVTGYTLPEETEHYRDAGFGVVLRKPVHFSEIAGAITLLNTSATTSLPALPAVPS